MNNGTHRILIGDCRDTLKSIETGSVQCIVTSPPYWGLRAYKGGEGMIGLEATFAEHLANLMQVFAECWRVLRDDGTMWCNYGDAFGDQKNLLGMPWRVAFALQDAGWTLRQDIIWHKPSPMPESVTDRCTKAHEYLFLLTKKPRYYFDAEAIKEAATAGEHTTTAKSFGGQAAGAGVLPSGNQVPGKTWDWGSTRNRRSVWTISTAAFADAHFATFPPALVEPCILAGTSERGCCTACGAPWARVVERIKIDAEAVADGTRRVDESRGDRTRKLNGKAEEQKVRSSTFGWRAGCVCNASTGPCTVLDPFGGSGTVAAVACPLGRNAVICEISPEYAAMAKERIGKACKPGTYASPRVVDAPLFLPA